MRAAIQLVAAVVLLVGSAFAVTRFDPQQLPESTAVPPVVENKSVCVPAAESATAYLGTADALSSLGGEPVAAPASQVVQDITEVQVLTAHHHLLGGTMAGSGSARSFASCEPPLAAGALVVGSSQDTELVIVNSDAAEASIDLTLFSAEGELEALGSRGIAVAPGASRVIALSVLADVEGPVGVAYTASVGRATVVARRNTGELADTLSSSMAQQQVFLPGVPADATAATIVIANPGNDRAAVDITALGATPAYTPAGGGNLTVPARSTLAVPLAEALAGEPTTLQVDSDAPVVASLVMAKGGSDQGFVAPVTAQTQLGAVVPAGGVLQVTNPGQGPVSLDVAVRPLEGEPSQTSLDIPAGTTFTLPIEAAGPSTVEIISGEPVVAVVTFVGEGGTTVVPVQPAGAVEATSLDARIDPHLR
ncbi:MAG: DUF5719 family protein [Arachnia sp.]